jgi:hypothetical protein
MLKSLLCFTLYCMPVTYAFSQKGEISGVVFSHTGTSIAYVNVSLLKGHKQVAKSYTDDSGMYIFKNLDSGEYEITTHTCDYKDALIKRVLISNNKAVKNIRLMPWISRFKNDTVSKDDDVITYFDTNDATFKTDSTINITKGKITGRITDDNGNPISNAKIKFFKNKKLLVKRHVDDSGYYSIVVPEYHNYKLRIQAKYKGVNAKERYYQQLLVLNVPVIKSRETSLSYSLYVKEYTEDCTVIVAY